MIYEPLPNGQVRLIGADSRVFAADWHKTSQATPELGGQLMHLIPGPNRYGLPDFYTARLGVEGQPGRHVLELALEGVVRGIQREAAIARRVPAPRR